jgi:dienelactone hydrolase
MGGRVLLGGLVAMLCGLAGAVNAQPDPASAPIVREELRIDAGSYSLAAAIVRPVGPGPYGAIVLNHGFAGTQEERAAQSWMHFRDAAEAFARHGYVVVLPSRRGFGKTGGALAEEPGPCWWPRFERSEEHAATDVMAAWEFTRRLPYVNPERMILAGQSAGAMVSIFTAGTRAPKGLVAVLGFAAGRGGQYDSPGVPCAIEPVARVMEAVGGRIKAPVLLQYAENDRFFGPQVSRHWFDALKSGGAKAEYVLQPALGRNGHFLFTQSAGLKLWLPSVQKFLSANGVKFVEQVIAPVQMAGAGLGK